MTTHFPVLETLKDYNTGEAFTLEDHPARGPIWYLHTRKGAKAQYSVGGGSVDAIRQYLIAHGVTA